MGLKKQIISVLILNFDIRSFFSLDFTIEDSDILFLGRTVRPRCHHQPAFPTEGRVSPTVLLAVLCPVYFAFICVCAT
jgi:hypothetical protein